MIPTMYFWRFPSNKVTSTASGDPEDRPRTHRLAAPCDMLRATLSQWMSPAHQFCSGPVYPPPRPLATALALQPLYLGRGPPKSVRTLDGAPDLVAPPPCVRVFSVVSHHRPLHSNTTSHFLSPCPPTPDHTATARTDAGTPTGG